jgi:4-amino-4-deoxy-L-arabinose transferase-like glycosyltransferase
MNRIKFLLAFVVLAYLCVGALYAIKTPGWQVPDEPAHYNYVRQLAEGRGLPVLELGDYDQGYLDLLRGERFPPDLSVEMVEYEDHQPPLYYVLIAPFYRVFDGALTPLRLFSVVLGAGVVLLAFAVAAAIFPGTPLLALGAAAFVAFLPQHVAMMAGVNNDSLAELLIGVVLWMSVRWVRKPAPGRWLVGLGVALGLGLVTKTTFVPIAPVVALAVFVAWWRDPDTVGVPLARRPWRELLRALALVFGPAVLIAAPWWIRNLSLYGGLDVYGLANHDAVVLGQPRTTDWIRDYGWGAWLERGITFTFQSFWGQFGWMGVLMPTLAAGFLVWLRRVRGEGQKPGRPGEAEWRPTQGTRHATRHAQLLVLATAVPWVVLAYAYYNRTFVQHQGRYLFSALIPIALGVALAMDALTRLVRWPERPRSLVFMTPYLAMVALDLYALWRLILPALA